MATTVKYYYGNTLLGTGTVAPNYPLETSAIPEGAQVIKRELWVDGELKDTDTVNVTVQASGGGGTPEPTTASAQFTFNETSGDLIDQVDSVGYTVPVGVTRTGTEYQMPSNNIISVANKPSIQNDPDKMTIRFKANLKKSLPADSYVVKETEYKLAGQAGDRYNFLFYGPGTPGYIIQNVMYSDIPSGVAEYVVTINVPTQELYWYINGVLVPPVLTLDASSWSGLGANLKTTTNALRIGGTTRESYWDLLEIYQGEFWTAQQVADAYNNG